MSIFTAENLTKKYPAFTLDSVSFSLEEGKITGFIGRNGAGKSTTLKSALGFVHPDSGSVRIFGMEYGANQQEIKQRLGFVSGGIGFYPSKKLKVITDVTKQFYKGWSDESYRSYMSKFELDDSKTPAQLSEGMKVKYLLALAMSHNAELLILDEPTSGLDPVSRDELLDIFLELSRNGTTIFFSTHITSDLDKCADNIIYIRKGRIAAEDNLQSFTDSYKYVSMSNEEYSECKRASVLIGAKPSKAGYDAIVRTADSGRIKVPVSACDLEKIMIHLEAE